MLELAPLLVSAVILGVLGGGHCLGMCGGLMSALTLAIPPEQRARRLRLLLAYNLGRGSGLTRIESLGRGLWRFIQPIANRLLPVSSLPRALLLGALWGWLPCGLVYSTLLWAASRGNALDSASRQCVADAGLRPGYLAGAAGNRTGGGTGHGATAQTQGTPGRWSAGDAVRPVDPARPAPALVDGTLSVGTVVASKA